MEKTIAIALFLLMTQLSIGQLGLEKFDFVFRTTEDVNSRVNNVLINEEIVLGNAQEPEFGSLNFNPIVQLQNQTLLPSLVSLENNTGLTCFTVFKNNKDEEQSLWHTSRSDSVISLLTSSRYANLTDWLFFDHIQRSASESEWLLSTVSETKDMEGAWSDLRFSDIPAELGLPVTKFDGEIAEVLVSNRLLNPIELNMTETYLAIKYGLGLFERDYLNSEGEVIWDYSKFDKFSNCIFGISRDDYWGLDQKQSMSSYSNIGFVLGSTISETNAMNSRVLENGASLLFGDNGMPYQLERLYESDNFIVKRIWGAEKHGVFEKLDFQIDQVPDENSDYVYLVIQAKNSDKLDLTKCDFIAVNKDGLGKLELSMNDDQIEQGYSLFSLVFGGVIIPKISIEHPQCNPELLGTITLGAEGPNSPFKFDLKHADSGDSKTYQSTGNQVFDISNLLPGEYTLKIEDTKGNLLWESFYLEPTDAPQFDLAESYKLNQPFELAVFEEGLEPGLEIKWFSEGELIDYGNRLLVKDKGSYYCEADVSGCIAQEKFTVEGVPFEGNCKTSLYPNPTTSGDFTYSALFQKKQTGVVSISDANAKLIWSMNFSNQPAMVLQYRLLESGIYFISINTDSFEKSDKIIVTP